MAVMLDSAALRDVPEQFGSDYCKTLSESLTSNMEAKEVKTPRLSRKLPVPPSARTKDHVDVTVRIDGDEELATAQFVSCLLCVRHFPELALL